MAKVKCAKAVKRTVESEFEINLTPAEIRQMLADQGHIIPASASIFIRVPGGGDWSNMDLDVDKDRPVIVRWKETEVSDGSE